MSTFVRRPVPCPRCGAVGDHEVATSVNADRSPELRQAILDERFQALTCDTCHQWFTFVGEFVYMDVGRHQLIGVFPHASEPDWAACEQQILAAYQENLGPEGPVVARPFGKGMVVRCVFGLGALREKLLLADAGLDDVLVEAAKLDVIRLVPGLELSPYQRPRVFEVGASEVAFILPPAKEDADRRPRRLPVPRPAFDDYLAAVAGDGGLLGVLGAGPYVDLGRICVAGVST